MKLNEAKMIVTGAAQGMGKHFALRLAEAGAQVAAGDVKDEALEALAKEAEGLPGKVHVHKLDVSSSWLLSRMVVATLERALANGRSPVFLPPKRS